MLAQMVGTDAYNDRITVRVVAGEGKVISYLSLVDNKTGDPTYFLGQ